MGRGAAPRHFKLKGERLFIYSDYVRMRTYLEHRVSRLRHLDRTALS
ncbi:hypothetical protein SAMN06295912_1294 [Sphingomonas laterariae]|uniref:Uncharacterized protein n=1 Tax=Edaphosphingomonas laterariae TaxID=861865 RepID=A0A239J0X7_9SPHN|nr:hypothetical protein SAMN06295912_1294 [Sphingomonas laterariae]